MESFSINPYFKTIPNLTPYGVLPYPDTAYPVPSSNFSLSEESDREDSFSQASEPHSTEVQPRFHLGPATWSPQELETARNKDQQTMPETLAPVAKMPTRNHHSAPKFDSKPASLSPFLDEVEQLFKSCGLTGRQKIEWAIRYAPNKERELWEMQESVGMDNWAEFKKELFELYPGSTGERKYLIANLQTLIEREVLVTIENAEDFGIYRRNFLTFATYLKKKTRLTDREISIYFLQGFTPMFRVKVQAQLKAENPTHHSDDPYSLAKISTAVLFILSCDHSATSHREPVSQTSVKKETFDLLNGYGNLNISAIAEEVAKRISSLEKQQASTSQNLPRIRNHQCVFCSDPQTRITICQAARTCPSTPRRGYSRKTPKVR